MEARKQERKKARKKARKEERKKASKQEEKRFGAFVFLCGLICLLAFVCSLSFALFSLLSFVCPLLSALFGLLSFVCFLILRPPFPPLRPCLLSRLPPPFVSSWSLWFFLKIISFLAADNAGFAKILTNFHFCAVRIGQKSVRDKKWDSYWEYGLLAKNILPVVATIIDFF